MLSAMFLLILFCLKARSNARRISIEHTYAPHLERVCTFFRVRCMLQHVAIFCSVEMWCALGCALTLLLRSYIKAYLTLLSVYLLVLEITNCSLTLFFFFWRSFPSFGCRDACAVKRQLNLLAHEVCFTCSLLNIDFKLAC